MKDNKLQLKLNEKESELNIESKLHKEDSDEILSLNDDEFEEKDLTLIEKEKKLQLLK